MLITRTKVSLEVTVMVANTDTKAVETVTRVVPKVESDKKLRTEIEKTLADNQKFVAVESSKEVEKLYGLDETIFMQNAVELDPKTRKPIENN